MRSNEENNPTIYTPKTSQEFIDESAQLLLHHVYQQTDLQHDMIREATDLSTTEKIMLIDRLQYKKLLVMFGVITVTYLLKTL